MKKGAARKSRPFYLETRAFCERERERGSKAKSEIRKAESGLKGREDNSPGRSPGKSLGKEEP